MTVLEQNSSADAKDGRNFEMHGKEFLSKSEGVKGKLRDLEGTYFWHKTVCEK